MGEFDEPGVRARKLGLLSAAASLASACVVSLAASPTGAQAPAPAQAELQQEIQKRDAVIADLLRRVAALERQAAATAPAPARPVAAAAPLAQAAPPAEAASAPVQTAQAAPPAQTPAAPVAAPPPSAAPGAPSTPAPGQFEVDEDAAERALERTLVRTGALLLSPGAFELEPSFRYSRLETDSPVFVRQGDSQLVGVQNLERDVADLALAARIGLPWDAQLDLSLPYRFEEEARIVSVNFADLQEVERDADGFGDLGVSLSKALMREKERRPDLIGAISWDTRTGAEAGDFRFGSDFDELTFSLTAVKRADPLVWVGSLAWQNTFEEDDIEPGDQWKVNVGAVLAVSPTTSLRFNLDQAFVEDARVRGVTVPGSDTNISTLTIGASQVLTRRVLLDIQAGVGLTDAAPDYFFNVALPVRFDSLF